MKVKQYKTILGEENIPMLVKEKEVLYQEGKIESPENVVKMMREVFSIHKQTEEYLYEICLNTKNHLIGIFEISHGCISCTVSSPREIFQKALLCGASAAILVHNHPSGDVSPSSEDMKTYETMKRLGDMMNVSALDSLIIGEHDCYSMASNA